MFLWSDKHTENDEFTCFYEFNYRRQKKLPKLGHVTLVSEGSSEERTAHGVLGRGADYGKSKERDPLGYFFHVSKTL